MTSLPRRLYRRLYWAGSDAPHWREVRRIRTLVYLGGGGLGDSLNCSAVIRELGRRAGASPSVMTPYPELFAGNPDARSVHAFDPRLVAALGRWSRPLIHPVYAIPKDQPPRRPAPADHLIAQLCASAGLTGDVDLRPWFYFLPGEREQFASHAGVVAVQSSCLNARHALPAKNWPVERMRQVVDALRQRHRVVQIGHPADEPLPGAEDLRGALSLRATAALLSQARYFVGLVGFLMHLSRAVGTRSVIIYGGREHPLQSGYAANANLVGEMPCSPCGIDEACGIGHGCMTGIGAGQVLRAAEALEGRLGAPLETDRVTLG